MKTEMFSGAAVKVLTGIATAASLAGATAIIKSAQANAVQDVRIERIEQATAKVDELRQTMDDTKTEVALLRKELEKHDDGK
jgi:cell division protein FtsB